ncbi:helix-turn-helix transcriptional regulator [Phyllobacterium sp. YR531]|uniref:AraC family transcriptional regulator n=1 Tax=Phyllobacterium sp. YR531 TaxID=1144343 RepID=UPI00026F8FEE|nr:helix-turn-helix transcriptional regulator [Phyllobacterium sp. YR531]EJN03619.1 DNA-binding domain-containing protein, AraC-type [Phyllobacterium sp. YR531]
MNEPDFASEASISAVRTLPDRMPNLNRHHHSHGQLLGTVSGLLSIGADTGRWVVPAVHAVWIPPRTEHQLLSHGPFEGWSVYVHETYCTDLPNRPLIIRVSGLLKAAAERATSWEQTILSPREKRVADVILDEIINAPEEKFSLAMPVDERLVRIANALIKNPEDNRRMQEWAEWAAIASRTLSRRFHKETGYSFMEWRQRARLMRALEMLSEKIPVTTIAFDLGYDNVSAFISMFRKTFGITPGRYFR